MKAEYSYIDIFSGCGGLSLGLFNSGWKGVFAVEKSPDAFATLRHNLIDENPHFNWPNWLTIQSWDIKDLLQQKREEIESLEGKVDLLVGGPPCQGFSTAGKRNILDPRNKLIHSYLNFVKAIKPRVLVFENVSGFTYSMKDRISKEEINFSELVIDELIKIGYSDATGKTIDFSDYGIPQKRKRFIVIASREDFSKAIFENLDQGREQFLQSKHLPITNSVSDAISDLEKRHGTTNCADSRKFKAGITSSAESDLQKFLQIPSKGNYTPDSHRYVNHREDTVELFNKLLAEAPRGTTILGKVREKFGIKKRSVTILDRGQPSPTITTIPDDFVHYSEPRVMTPRECARLQTFPDWFEFKGPYTSGGEKRTQIVPRYSQIGNAVPPLFAEQLGMAIMKVLDNEK
ncbi:DNA cytosine methyltransferase [Chloroflexota bacterium]|nr:DNA cytosine methyltransferase [Chloroflexota bacterium]